MEGNKSCIMVASTLETKCSKLIDVKLHFVRQCLSDNTIKLYYITTKEQVPDIFTKSFLHQNYLFSRQVKCLCYLNVST